MNYAKYASLDPGYLQATIQSGVAALLFYGPGKYYDTTFIAQDYNNRGTITVGEAATGALVPTAHAYAGSVLVISGQEDVVFCGSFGLPGIPLLGFLGTGNCGTGPNNKLAQTNIIYPSASNYTVSLELSYLAHGGILLENCHKQPVSSILRLSVMSWWLKYRERKS